MPSTETQTAVVDGREIRQQDVDKAYQRAAPTSPPPSADEMLTAKLNVLNDLIVQDVLAARARAARLDVTDAELDAAFAEAKKDIPDESFQEELTRRGLTVADVRDGLRGQLLAQKVIDRDVTAKVAVSEQDVADYYSANRAQFNLAEDAYRVAQIVITPGRESQPANRKGDDATTAEAAAKKLQMVMERLKGGADFAELARDYSEDPQSAPQGGDLGLVPVTRLKEAPPALRDAVLKVSPGTVTTVSAGGLHTVVLVLGKETAGQRDLTVPAVRETITATIKEQKAQLLRTAYLALARNDATVVNHLARRIVASQGAMPSLGLASPPGR